MSEPTIDKEKECFEKLRTLNKRKSHISALKRYNNHLNSIRKFVEKRMEKEQNKETQNYLKRFISYLDTQIDMIMLSVERSFKEVEEIEDKFDVECRDLVEEKRQKFVSIEYNLEYVNPNSRGGNE
ncbi:MAG: hypothetical protein JHC26_09000 [Thermofilum sp.]|jgi:chlorite dismutase|uniref:hypothetical protein n=1 Tax=Thermofilum sp. TaxID=1961369 RepID=UPI00258D930C|nr:hypothetical protein [Thermofilum sp.]MCI4409216.1 hypothetical protein [Thermofilum sp.]